MEGAFKFGAHQPSLHEGEPSAKTAKLMVFKLVNAAAKTWRRFRPMAWGAGAISDLGHEDGRRRRVSRFAAARADEVIE